VKHGSLCAATLTAMVFLACSGPGDTSFDDDLVDYDEIDQIAQEDVDAPESAEARGWLAVPSNAIFEGSKDEVSALTEAFYSAGCPRVYITGIERMGGTQVSASMVAELPSDPSARSAALEIANEFYREQGEGDLGDRGQRYLMLLFD